MNLIFVVLTVLIGVCSSSYVLEDVHIEGRKGGRVEDNEQGREDDMGGLIEVKEEEGGRMKRKASLGLLSQLFGGFGGGYGGYGGGYRGYGGYGGYGDYGGYPFYG